MKHEIEVNRRVTVTKIALTGQMRAGKDEIAKHLVISHGFNRVAFGDELKRLAHEAFPDVSESSKPRALYQTFGQLLREIDPDIWVRHAERKVNAIINVNAQFEDHIGIVISDLRQPNEFDWAIESGFTIAKVTAPVGKRLVRAKAAGDSFTEADLAHETESHIEGFAADYEIANDGTVDDLWAKVDEMIGAIGKR